MYAAAVPPLSVAGLQKEPIFEGVQDGSTEYCVQAEAFRELVVHNQVGCKTC